MGIFTLFSGFSKVESKKIIVDTHFVVLMNEIVVSRFCDFVFLNVLKEMNAIFSFLFEEVQLSNEIKLH